MFGKTAAYGFPSVMEGFLSADKEAMSKQKLRKVGGQHSLFAQPFSRSMSQNKQLDTAAVVTAPRRTSGKWTCLPASVIRVLYQLETACQ
jgi:hypothetical protein